ERVTRPTLPIGRDPLDWGDQKLTELIAVFRYADPDANVWGFGTDSTVGRWVRRMLVETGVHRWDAQHAFGEATPLTGLVAATAPSCLPGGPPTSTPCRPSKRGPPISNAPGPGAMGSRHTPSRGPAPTSTWP